MAEMWSPNTDVFSIISLKEILRSDIRRVLGEAIVRSSIERFLSQIVGPRLSVGDFDLLARAFSSVIHPEQTPDTPIFTFPYNPSFFSYSVSILETVENYGGGVILRVGWGAQLIPASVKGWATLLPPPQVRKILLPYGLDRDYRISWGWMLLNFLEKYVSRQGSRPIAVVLNSKLWIGWIKNYSYNLDAKSPFFSTWTLDFSFHPYSGIPIYSHRDMIDMLRNIGRMVPGFSNLVLPLTNYTNYMNWLPSSEPPREV